MAARKQNQPHAINCLRALEAFVGGRQKLADELGISKGSIDRWVHRGRIPGDYVLGLTKLNNKFSAEDFLMENRRNA